MYVVVSFSIIEGSIHYPKLDAQKYKCNVAVRDEVLFNPSVGFTK